MIRCMRCMKEYSEDSAVCIHCGYQPGSEAGEHYYLPEGAVLQDRYTVGKVLGHGGFGITYVGFDNRLKLKVAIKEYLPAEISTRAEGETTVKAFTGEKHDAYVYGLGRFIDEAQTLAQYNSHPCIVSANDFFEANNTAYLVMEFLEGITLGEYIQRSGGRISEEETLSIIRPVIDALREVHSGGMIHRDVSPDNIFITRQKQIKLLDFGAARHAMSEKSKSLSVVLKPGYAPPEQYYSRGKQGPWTDVYAVGATMYKMLTGQTPPESLERVMDNISRVSEFAEGVSPKTERAIEKAMAIRPEERYPGMEALLGALTDKEYAGAIELQSYEKRSSDGITDRFISMKLDKGKKNSSIGNGKLKARITAITVICITAFMLAWGSRGIFFGFERYYFAYMSDAVYLVPAIAGLFLMRRRPFSGNILVFAGSAAAFAMNIALMVVGYLWFFDTIIVFNIIIFSLLWCLMGLSLSLLIKPGRFHIDLQAQKRGWKWAVAAVLLYLSTAVLVMGFGFEIYSYL